MPRLLLAATFGLLAFPALAQMPSGDPEAGRAIAKTWCANCHSVEPGAARQSADGVPSFPAIANQASTTVMSLQAFLQTPHARMPNFQLSHRQIEDVIAYIIGLKGR